MQYANDITIDEFYLCKKLNCRAPATSNLNYFITNTHQIWCTNYNFTYKRFLFSESQKKSKKQNKSAASPKEDRVEENIKKLLALSTPTANKAVAEKVTSSFKFLNLNLRF